MKKTFSTAIVMVLMTGCSSFNREWKSAMAQPSPPPDISGAWEGRWLSDRNGHTGKLRGVLARKSAGEYDAHFHATFWKIFHATYHVPLKYEERNGEFILTGETDLGKLSGGIYTYEGKATAEKFFSTYKNKYDHGTFNMTRPDKKE